MDSTGLRSTGQSSDRPIYETADNRAEEHDIARWIRECWPGVGLVKLPYEAEIDFDCYSADRKYLGCLEVKRRYYPAGTFKDLLLSERKFITGDQRAQERGGCFIIVVGLDDRVLWYRYEVAHLWSGLVWRELRGGRTTQTRDERDIEPVFHIPFSLFQPLEPQENP